MYPITRKDIVTGGSWELRVKLTNETREKYQQLKEKYQAKHGKSYSESAFLARLLDDLVTVSRMAA